MESLILGDYSIDSDSKATFYFDDEVPFAVEVEYNFYEDSYLVWNGYTDVDEYFLNVEWGINDEWLTHPETGDLMESNLYDVREIVKYHRVRIHDLIDSVLTDEAEKEMKERKENWV